MIKISVLMCIHSCTDHKHFAEALKSISIDQTRMPDEFIIVFDGIVKPSIKNHIELFKIEHGLIIKIIQIRSSKGLGNALKVGIENCNGDFIARMDDDDISLPSRIELQESFLSSNTHVDIVGSWISYFSEDASCKFINGKIIQYPKTHADCFKQFRYRDPMAHPAVMFNKSYFEKAGNYSNLRKSQDTELWSRGFLQKCIFGNIPQVLLKYRFDSNTIKKRSEVSTLISFMKLRIKINKTFSFGLKSYLGLFFYFIIFAFASEKIIFFLYKRRSD